MKSFEGLLKTHESSHSNARPEDLTDVLRDHEFGLSEMVHQVGIIYFFVSHP